MEKSKKLYSQTAISITTFIGGPLAAGILIRENYKNLDKNKQGMNALIIGAVSTIMLLIGAFFIAENYIDKIPRSSIPFIYIGIIYLIVEKIHGKELKSHKENSGEFYSVWKAAGVGIISLLVILIIAFLAGDLFKPNPNYDNELFESELSKFSENERNSLKVFDSFGVESTSYLINELIKSEDLWEENILIIDRVSKIENLPAEFSTTNEKLKKYCKLRIEHFQFVLKAVAEETNEYDTQIENITSEIELIFGQLN